MAGFESVSVYIVEDDCAVALLLEDMLDELGCQLSGSAGSIDQAARAAEDIDADVAILDVNLGGASVFPVAEILRGRGVPILFTTGYGEAGIPDEFASYPVLAKPFTFEGLADMLQRAIAPAPQPGRAPST